MKYIKRFNESNGSIIDEQVIELLSHSGWKQIDPPTDENLDVQLVYKISDNIFIDMISLKESSTDSLIYYMRKGDNRFIYINPYNDNFSEIYSKHDSLYKRLSNYERMMKICNYLLPFFEDEPDDKTKDNIRECFYEIEDILSIEPEISWGYTITGRHVNNGLEFGFFQLLDSVIN